MVETPQPLGRCALIRLPLAILLAASPPAASCRAPLHLASRSMGKAEAQATIWAKEQDVYRARGRGDMGPYQASIARDYAAWPPFRDTPAGPENLNALQKVMGGMARATPKR